MADEPKEDRRVNHALRERIDRLELDPRILREVSEARKRMDRAQQRLRTIEFEVNIQMRRSS